MNDTVLLAVWVTLIVAAVVGMAGLLAVVGGGAISELKQSLRDLRDPASSSQDPGSTEDDAEMQTAAQTDR